MNWIISANGKMYDHAKAFEKWGFIDWYQANRKYSIGDIIYIYCTKPIMRVMYKTKVEKVNMTSSEITNDYEFWINKEKYTNSLSGKFARLKLVDQSYRDELQLSNLKKHGLKAAPQGAFKVSDELKEYIDKFLIDTYSDNTFPESDIEPDCIEGHKTTVYVNRYERSSVARNKCIEYNGCYCHVCGIDFKNIYGDVGAGFIHVHHIVPLSKIDESYIVDYKNDLVPVCPNCHAMLHRKVNGRYLSVEELRNLVKEYC